MFSTRFAHVAVISVISAWWWPLASAARPNERSSSGKAATSSVQLLAHGHMVSRGRPRPLVNEALDLLHALEGHGRYLQSQMGDDIAADEKRARDFELAAEKDGQLKRLESRKPELANKIQSQLAVSFGTSKAAPKSLAEEDKDLRREEKAEEDQVRKMISREEVEAMEDKEDKEDFNAHVAKITELMADPSNLIAADGSMLTKLPPQYQDINHKFSLANHNVWKDGENGGENFIRDTGHSWITEAQKFQTTVKDLHSHADEVYADMVHDHEVAAEKQMTSFKTEIAKLNPVFDAHANIAAKVEGQLFANAPPVRSDDLSLLSISQDQEAIQAEIRLRQASGRQ